MSITRSGENTCSQEWHREYLARSGIENTLPEVAVYKRILVLTTLIVEPFTGCKGELDVAGVGEPV